MYAKYARTARKTLQKMLTIKEITSIIMHHLPSIQIEDCGSKNKPARRPAEMATADLPKDSEPPTVSGMPSKFSISHFAKNVKQQITIPIYKWQPPLLPTEKHVFCTK